MPYSAGPRNLITDVAGLSVGNAHDAALRSGVTVVIPDAPVTAAVQVLGGAPGTRETDALEPHNSLQAVHGIALSGGSAFGLDAASGVQSLLRQRKIGVEVLGHRVPIVPAAILFDLYNGGDKDWGLHAPYRELGYEAAQHASAQFDIGTAGAGYGATTSTFKGGLGSASTRLKSGITIGALVAVNPAGSVTVGRTSNFWAAPFEIGDEFGGFGLPSPLPKDATELQWKFGVPPRPAGNTTIAVIATDAALSKAEAKRLAIAAHDGIARAIWPAHTPGDGDLVFALATGATPVKVDMRDMMELGAVAAATMARAIARGVFRATPQPGDIFPAWSTRSVCIKPRRISR